MSSLRSLSNEGTSSSESMQTHGPGVKVFCTLDKEKEVKRIVISATKMIKKQLLDAPNARRSIATPASLDELFDPEIEATARHNNARRREMATNEQQAPNLNSINQMGGYENKNYRGKNQFHQGNQSNLSYGNPNNALQPPPPPGFSVTNEIINEEKKPKIDGLLMAFMRKTDKFIGESQARVGKNQFYQDNRSNLSYGNPNNALQPPPGFSVTNEMINVEKKPKMDDLLMAFMGKIDKFTGESQTRVGGNQLFQGNQSNLSYGDSNNALPPPPGFSVTNEMVNEEKKPKMDDLLIEFMAKTDKFMMESQARVEKLENAVGAMGVQMKMFEKQLGQLATVVGNLHQSGQFPSNTTVNPKKQCSTIHLHTDVPTPLLAAAVVPPKTASENPNSTIKIP
ncbi:hypothetical protein C2S52_006593 [Perilla frutescens var. hirtella]|nr:hypothetical protein C2S52_006593 [Perilla frutescens var. hirtella]